jgi:hypothetical protein
LKKPVNEEGKNIFEGLKRSLFGEDCVSKSKRQPYRWMPSSKRVC